MRTTPAASTDIAVVLTTYPDFVAHHDTVNVDEQIHSAPTLPQRAVARLVQVRRAATPAPDESAIQHHRTKRCQPELYASAHREEPRAVERARSSCRQRRVLSGHQHLDVDCSADPVDVCKLLLRTLNPERPCISWRDDARGRDFNVISAPGKTLIQGGQQHAMTFQVLDPTSRRRHP